MPRRHARRLPAAARARGPAQPARFFAGAWPAIQLAFVSRSSVGTMPVTQRVVERLGVPREYASFAVPFGATTKMDGCAAIYPALAAIFVAQVFGVSLSVQDYLLIAFVSVVGSAATAGLTGAIVMLTLTLTTLGLPLDGITHSLDLISESNEGETSRGDRERGRVGANGVGSTPLPRRTAMLRRVLDVLPQGVVLVARDGTVLWVNAAWRDFSSRTAGPVAAAVGLNYFDVCRRAAEAGEPVARAVLSALTAAVDGEDPGETSGWEYATHGLGVQRWFRVTVRPLADPSGPIRSTGAVVMHEDVTARVLAERAYRRRAFDDPVTGLANELLFTDRAARAIAAAARSGRRAGLVLVDVPGAELAGDGSARPAVRRVLRAAGERVRADLRLPDLVARWSGGTLVVLADDVGGLADLAVVAGRIGRVVAEAAYGEASPSPRGEPRPPVLGLATSHKTDSPHDLFSRAERSLSRCRARGVPSLLGGEAAPVVATDDGVVIDLRVPVRDAVTS